MKIKIFFSLVDFQLDGTNKYLYYGINILRKGSVGQDFFDKHFLEAIGTMYADFFTGRDFAYMETNVTNEENFKTSVTIKTYTLTISELLNSLMQFLWFVKDNSVSVFHVVTQTIAGDKAVFKCHINVELATTSTGTKEVTLFNESELKTATDIFSRYQMILREYKYYKHKDTKVLATEEENLVSPDKVINPVAISADYNQMPLIERALMFVFSARTTSFLPHKLSLYIQSLECLFVIEGGGELQVKISERIAFYIGNKDERKSIHDTIKDAYKFRSKYVHGDKLPNGGKKEVLMPICKEIDRIARIVFNKIIAEDYKIWNKQGQELKELEGFLSNLIFQSDSDMLSKPSPHVQ